MFCKKCGTEIPEGSIFCNKCGSKILVEEIKNDKVEKKSRNKPKPKEVILSLLRERCKEPAILAKVGNLKLNTYVAFYETGFEIFQYDTKKAIINEIRSCMWEDFQTVTVDNFFIKSELVFSNSNDKVNLQVVEMGKDIIKFIQNNTSISLEVLPRIWWKKIVGFRSGKKWKMVSATLFYLWVIFSILSPNSQAKVDQKSDNKLQSTTVTSVSLNKTTDALTAGSTDTLSATIAPSEAAKQTVTWTSSDKAIATVDTYGNVVAVSAGTATITATAGDKTATCTLTINPVVNVSSVSLNKTTDTLAVGGTDVLNATIAPGNATNSVVNWTSSNPNVATVSNGIVKAVSAGTSVITATTSDGNKAATCTVTVNPPNYNTGITYDQLARTPDKFNGKKVQFTGKVIQVMEGNNETDLRIAVNDNYDTVLLVAYNPSISPTRALENDHVTIKGISKGLYTYKSTLGGNITIPLVSVDIITIN